MTIQEVSGRSIDFLLFEFEPSIWPSCQEANITHEHFLGTFRWRRKWRVSITKEICDIIVKYNWLLKDKWLEWSDNIFSSVPKCPINSFDSIIRKSKFMSLNLITMKEKILRNVIRMAHAFWVETVFRLFKKLFL